MTGQEEQMYIEPRAYFDEHVKTPPAAAENVSLKRTELDRLRAQVAEADAAAAKATDWTERTRAEQHAKSLARELQSAEFNAKLVLGGAREGQATQQGRYVVSDCGSAYVFVAENRTERKQQIPPASAATAEQQYAEPVGYFETGEAR